MIAVEQLALLVLSTTLLVVGVAVAAIPPPPEPVRRFDPGAVRAVIWRAAGASVIGALVAIVSGWLVPGIVVGVGTFWAIGGPRRRRHRASTEIARLDALASWIESVRDVLLAGEQPVGAIATTVSAAPPPIRPAVRRLAAGLGRHDTDAVFRRFADDLDDPVGDLVATGLSIAVRRGARTVPVLTALAAQTRQQVDRRRLVEAERAPTRREVQALTVVMAGLLLGLLLLGRSEYLAAYDTFGGQVFLGVALAGYAALIVRVRRLAAFPRPARFLSGRVGTGIDDPARHARRPASSVQPAEAGP